MNVITVFATLLCVSLPAYAAPRSDVSRSGITFEFDAAYETGQYANGDWWVVGPVVITAMTPDFDGTYNGWEVNPDSNALQGFDNRSPMGAFVTPLGLPYTAHAGESVVKTDSWEERDGDCQCDAQDVGPSGSYSHPVCIWAAAVLTVVDAVPADSGATVFRPPYFGTDKPVYRTTQLRTDLLPSLGSDRISAALQPALTGIADQYSRVFLDHGFRMNGYSLLPADWTREYGGNIGQDVGDAVLRLFLDDSLQDKTDALIGVVQRGIDLYAMYRRGHGWPGFGGWGNGRKLPVAFSAVMLGDTAMQADLARAPDKIIHDPVTGAPAHPFHEDNLITFGDRAGRILFGQQWDTATEEKYWQNQAGGGSSRDIRDPYGYIDGGEVPGSLYQLASNSATWRAPALACYLMPDLRAVWNNDHFLDYTDRWVTFGTWTQPDPCAPAVYMGSKDAFLTYGADSGYTVTWGPDPDNPGDCIRDTDSTDGVGRFPDLHGTNANGGGYSSNFVAAMWNVFRDSAVVTGIDGPRTVTGVGAACGIFVYPNPVRGVAAITAEGSVYIFNANGRLVWTQAETRHAPSRWNGCDVSGRPVSDGTYIVRSGNAVRRIIIIRE